MLLANTESISYIWHLKFQAQDILFVESTDIYLWISFFSNGINEMKVVYSSPEFHAEYWRIFKHSS
jgi:hypothetical protein